MSIFDVASLSQALTNLREANAAAAAASSANQAETTTPTAGVSSLADGSGIEAVATIGDLGTTTTVTTYANGSTLSVVYDARGDVISVKMTPPVPHMARTTIGPGAIVNTIA